MNILGFEIKRINKDASPKTGYALSAEDREAGMEVRRLNLERKRLIQERQMLQEQINLERQRAELDELREQLYDDDDNEESDGNLEQMLVPILLAAFNKGAPAPSAPVPQGIPAENVQTVNLTDDEIRSIIKQFPKAQVKMAKALSDDVLRKSVYARVPNISPDSVERAITIFRAEF